MKHSFDKKERIKSRMLKNAASMWGYSGLEKEANFDPIIGMLLEACAGEIEKISHEIHNSQSRLVEKLIELIVPDVITGPLPAHAILHTLPNSEDIIAHPSIQFCCTKKKDETYFFSPTSTFDLLPLKVKFLAAGSQLYEIEHLPNKLPYAESNHNKMLDHGSLWIGVEKLNDIEDNLENVSFFFDINDESYEDIFYQLLKKTQWFCGEHELNVVSGYRKNICGENSHADDFFKKDVSASKEINEHVNRFYKKKFLYIKKIPLNKKEKTNSIPEDLKSTFNIERGNFDDILWLQVKFPKVIKEDILNDIICATNCFPVINRRLNNINVRLNEYLNVIPLLSDAKFLDIRSLEDSDGVEYHGAKFTKVKDIRSDSFILRSGGVSRFDSRKAMEVIDYLTELLRDESAAFSVLGSEVVATDIKKLKQLIASLEKKLSNVSIEKENAPYIIFKSKSKFKNLFISFWSTKGADANRIKEGTPVELYSDSDFVQEETVLMTTSVGGRNALDTEDRVNKFRKAFISKGRVVTKQDISALCFEHYGKILNKVEIKKGVMADANLLSGFVKTIDLHLTLNKDEAKHLSKEEVKFLADDLKIKLEEQAIDTFPFRVLSN